MATYYYNQKQTRALQEAINNAPKEFKVWIQPTHHGGCCQVLRMKDNSQTETDYCKDIFRSRSSGYRNFCYKLGIQQSCLELNSDWINIILKAKTLKFHANIVKDRVEIKLSTIVKS